MVLQGIDFGMQVEHSRSLSKHAELCVCSRRIGRCQMDAYEMVRTAKRLFSNGNKCMVVMYNEW